MTLKEDVIRGVTSNFRDEVINAGSKIYQKEHLEKFKLCMQCGKCAGGCPSGRRTSWRIRKIFEETSLGLKEKVFSDESLWNCTTCYTCQERCPRGIRTTDIVRAIRNLAVKSGYIKDAHKKVCWMRAHFHSFKAALTWARIASSGSTACVVCPQAAHCRR